MNLQPTLTGTTITLRPLRAQDFDALFAAASDPLIWEQHPHNTRYQLGVFRQFFDAAMESKGAFAVLDQKSNEIIGSSRYYDYNPQKNSVIIGYTFLTRKYWGGSTNKEMKILMLNHAFAQVERVLFEIGEKNLRSRKAIEKFGAQLIAKEELDLKPHLIYCIDRKFGVTDWGRLY